MTFDFFHELEKLETFPDDKGGFGAVRIKDVKDLRAREAFEKWFQEIKDDQQFKGLKERVNKFYNSVFQERHIDELYYLFSKSKEARIVERVWSRDRIEQELQKKMEEKK